jgi:SAM-dependent methyltransferase
MDAAQSGPPPQAIVMQMAMGAWVSQTIAAVTRLDIPDLLEKHGPLTAHQLTGEHGIDARPDFLERALRACASAGVFTETADGRFGPTPLSAVLTLDSPTSVKRFVELIGGRWWTPFGGLLETLRTGEPQSTAPRASSEGTVATRTEKFAQAMKSRVESTRGVLAHHDFSRARSVVDVGGGLGHLALALVERYPHLRATVLDLPEVIAAAQRHAANEDPAVLARLSFEAGDMFVDVPPGDLYLLKAIIHDWDDERGVRVLRNCRARLARDGRILCVDNVLPPMGDTTCSGTKLLDMLMMVSLPGKERTEAEWRALYAAAGLRVATITLVNPRSGESIIEGVPTSGSSEGASDGPLPVLRA